mgnify:CR=1 FL=1
MRIRVNLEFKVEGVNVLARSVNGFQAVTLLKVLFVAFQAEQIGAAEKRLVFC